MRGKVTCPFGDISVVKGTVTIPSQENSQPVSPNALVRSCHTFSKSMSSYFTLNPQLSATPHLSFSTQALSTHTVNPVSQSPSDCVTK